MGAEPQHAPPPPLEASATFGDRLPLACRYADLLATTGISHGLVGPREAARLWERHLLNCAVVEQLIPSEVRVVDIGSGAGLPGLVLAIARPDLRVDLVEPLLRRTTWLESAVRELGLDNVAVHRGRAEEMRLHAPVVTARAVAALDALVRWSFPLLQPGGRLLALKGGAAAAELDAARDTLRRAGARSARVHVLAEGEPAGPVRVIEVAIGAGSRRGVVRGQPDVSRGRAGRGSAAGRPGRRTR